MNQTTFAVESKPRSTCAKCGGVSVPHSLESVECGSANVYEWENCTVCGHQCGNVPDSEYAGDDFEPPAVDWALWDAQIAADIAEDRYFDLGPALMQPADLLALCCPAGCGG